MSAPMTSERLQEIKRHAEQGVIARSTVPALVAEIDRLTNHNEALIQSLVHIKLATEVRPVDDRWVSHISQLAEDALEDHA